jgi:serine/threonine protein phosphatase PrpC
MQFETEVLSDMGGRSENQDFLGFSVLDRFACWVLADGLGGHGGGAKAAKTAVQSILGSFKMSPACSPEALQEYLRSANGTLGHLQKQEARWSRMATTAVVLLTDGRSALWAHVGDSRLYLFRRGRVEFQTRDHSVPQALCNAGEITPAQIRFHEDRNRLLRSLGWGEHFDPTIRETGWPLDADDTFLLCTDGFWEYVTEEEMEADLAGAIGAKHWLKTMASRRKARAETDSDNYSAIAIFLRTESSASSHR